MVLNPADAKESGRNFWNDHPIHVEVGSGKGAFTGMAKANQILITSGLTFRSLSLVTPWIRFWKLMYPILKLLWWWFGIDQLFCRWRIDRLYLNFSDPWLNGMKNVAWPISLSWIPSSRILSEKGGIHFKTDNRGLFEYSLISLFRSMAWFSRCLAGSSCSDFEGNV